MRRLSLLVAALAYLALLTAGFYFLQGEQRSGVGPITATATSCHSDGVLPDARCTPGFVDPHVTQSNIHSTICVSGYTATVRPSSSYTEALKTEQIKQYGYLDDNPALYEEDHLIPLELGGHPTDARNLWPEPRTSATRKDGVENALHRKVCAGTMTLAAAQSRIAADWQTAGG